MANPFPGMDPYLESDLWPSVHDDLLSEVVRRLSPPPVPLAADQEPWADGLLRTAGKRS
jgi:hypothetical protein